MTVRNYETDNIAKRDGVTPYFETTENYGRIRFVKFCVKATPAGAENSTFDLVKLPAGRVTVVAGMSKIYHTAGGTGRELNVGYSAYRKPLATSDTVADDDAFADDLDVAAAGSKTPDNNLDVEDAGKLSFDSVSGVTITAKMDSGSVPDNFELAGYLAIVVD